MLRLRSQGYRGVPLLVADAGAVAAGAGTGAELALAGSPVLTGNGVATGSGATGVESAGRRTIFPCLNNSLATW